MDGLAASGLAGNSRVRAYRSGGFAVREPVGVRDFHREPLGSIVGFGLVCGRGAGSVPVEWDFRLRTSCGLALAGR